MKLYVSLSSASRECQSQNLSTRSCLERHVSVCACACAHSQVATSGGHRERARDEGGIIDEREGCNGQGAGGRGDVHAWEEEKGIERDGQLPRCVEHACVGGGRRELDEERRLAIERETERGVTKRRREDRGG